LWLIGRSQQIEPTMLDSPVPAAPGSPPHTPAARAERPDNAGFFRHHGIWAPGVRLMRRIGFRAKAAIIASTFVLPLAVIGWQYLVTQNGAIAFSAKERLGITYAQGLMPALEATLRDQLAAVKKASGVAPPEADPGVAAALAGLAKAQAAVGEELETAALHSRVVKAHAAPVTATELDGILAGYAERTAALQALLGQSTDASNLTLDPDIDTYYLMDIAMFRLPAMVDAAAQVRSLGVAILLGKVQGPAATRQVIEGLALVEQHAQAIEAGLAKAIAYNNDVAAKVDAKPALQAWRSFAGSVEAGVLRAEGPQGDVAALVAASSETLRKMFALASASSAELDVLVAARVDGLEGQRAACLLVLFLGLSSAVYLFMCFGKVLEGGLREVARHIDAMRDGDLTTTPKPWGADEAARLMLTLSQMQASLRAIVSQVRGASDSIVTASAQISGGAMDLSTRTEQSAANLQQTASAMEQISATVRSNEGSVNEVTRLALSNAEVAERGSRIVGEVVSTMREINGSSGRIGDIVGTIDSIAFQTNILALNAAVEAARAGEQGRGFAVVASEVRSLAQRSSVAAREIKQLIASSVEQVENGTRVVQDAGATIGEIVGTARRVRELLDEVATGAREQNQGVTMSAKAVQELDARTQQNAALVEQTAAAAGALREQAQKLAERVANFKLPA
jgi:methyl-accepting chemotaxis protein